MVVSIWFASAQFAGRVVSGYIDDLREALDAKFTTGTYKKGAHY